MNNILHNYAWTGLDARGKKMTGMLRAKTKLHATVLLQKNEITILSLQRKYFLLGMHQKLTRKNKLDLMHQLQILLQSGISLSDALTLIAKTSPNKATQIISRQLTEKIISGKSFANALSDFSAIFNITDCKMIHAGEMTGELERVLTQLISDQHQKIQLKNKIVKTLLYPTIIFCCAILMAMGLLIFVIPQFATLYQNYDAQLPLITQCFIHISHFMQKNILGIIMALLLLIMIIIASRDHFLKIWQHCQPLLFLITPYRAFVVIKQVAHWSQLMTLILQSHIPLIDALHITEDTLPNIFFKTHMHAVNQEVIAGKSLYAALNHCPHFPAYAKHLISVGENADALDSMMGKIAQIYREKLDALLDLLSKLLEPVIMLGVTGLVSGFIVAMYLPIFRMGNII